MLMSYATEPWTLDQVHRLPEDGNRYELLDGELFVTPPPSFSHELLASRLRSLLDPFVQQHGLGDLLSPRAVVRMLGSEVEPDLMLCPRVSDPATTWDDLPAPLLVVEVLSPATTRRDQTVKRAYYRRIGVAEYWMVDGAARTVTVISSRAEDVVEATELMWQPPGTSVPLRLDVRAFFRDTLANGPLSIGSTE